MLLFKIYLAAVLAKSFQAHACKFIRHSKKIAKTDILFTKQQRRKLSVHLFLPHYKQFYHPFLLF
jgi:hypothetical protein